eukprot:5241298-Amphidinium_carterae.2
MLCGIIWEVYTTYIFASKRSQKAIEASLSTLLGEPAAQAATHRYQARVSPSKHIAGMAGPGVARSCDRAYLVIEEIARVR